jgi:hypothetical protein
MSFGSAPALRCHAFLSDWLGILGYVNNDDPMRLEVIARKHVSHKMSTGLPELKLNVAEW